MSLENGIVTLQQFRRDILFAVNRPSITFLCRLSQMFGGIGNYLYLRSVKT